MDSHVPEHQRNACKSKGFFKNDELRRRRDEQSVEIRKQKREESLAKKRNLAVVNAAVSDSEDEEASSVALNQQLQEQHRKKLQKELQKHLPQMMSGLYADGMEEQLQATTKFRMLLSKQRNPPIEEVISCGVVLRFVEFLRSPHSLIQFEAAW
ncbi:Importin subunit alpha-1, partial [Dispira parvispora]